VQTPLYQVTGPDALFFLGLVAAIRFLLLAASAEDGQLARFLRKVTTAGGHVRQRMLGRRTSPFRTSCTEPA